MLTLKVEIAEDGRFRLETFDGVVVCAGDHDLASTVRQLTTHHNVHVAEPSNPLVELVREHVVERYGATTVAAAEHGAKLLVGFGQKHLKGKGGCSRKAASVRGRATARK
jgi:hypothetical protein